MNLDLCSLRDRLALELRELLASADEEEEIRSRRLKHRLETEYCVLMDSDDGLHNIYHYLADADVRARDSRYRSSQQERIGEIIEHLEGGRSIRPALYVEEEVD